MLFWCEVVDGVVSKGEEGVLCKLDMEKAYDHVYWDFVDYMLERLELAGKWKKWMKACITIASFVVIVNGGPSSFFRASRDLR